MEKYKFGIETLNAYLKEGGYKKGELGINLGADISITSTKTNFFMRESILIEKEKGYTINLTLEM